MAKKINPFTNIKRAIAPVISQARNFEGMPSMQVGFGSKVFRSDRQGIWLGAKKFVDAPFHVDMDGNAKATSITLTDYFNLTGNDLDDVTDGAIHKKTTANEKTGAGRGFNALSSNNRYVEWLLASEMASGSDPSTGVVMDSLGIRGFKSGVKQFEISAISGNAFFQGQVAGTSGYFGDVSNGVNIDSNGLTLNGTGYFRSAISGARTEILSNDISLYSLSGSDSHSNIAFKQDGVSDKGWDLFFTAFSGGGLTAGHLLLLPQSSNASPVFRVGEASFPVDMQVEGGIQIDGNLTAGSDNSYTIGNSSNGFSTIYIGGGGRNFDDDGTRLTASSDFKANGSLHATGNIFTGGVNANEGSVNCALVSGDGGNIDMDVAGGGINLGASGEKISCYGGTPIARQTVTGSRGGNVALADLLTKLANLNLIIDSTT